MRTKSVRAVTTALLFSAGVASAQLTWQGADIGGPTYAGSYTDNGDGTYSVVGGGDDVWGTSDKFYYYYASVTGLVWDATVRVRDLQGPDNWTKCELMVRSSTAANSSFIAAMTTRAAGRNMISTQYRPTNGAQCGAIENSPELAPSYPNTWLRMSRVGPVFRMYTSTDGINWALYSEIDTTKTDRGFSGVYWPENMMVGIAVTAHNNNDPNMATAVISDLSVQQKPLIAEPTQLVMTVQPTNRTVYAGQPVSFYSDTTNNAVPLLPPSYTTYQWFKNSSAIPGATGRNLTFLTTAADNGAQLYCHVTCHGYGEATLIADSSTVTLTVLPGTIYTNALRAEVFWGATSVAQVEGGAVGAGAVSAWTALDQPNNIGDNYVRRVSGYFIPWVTDVYEFYINSDDDSHLYLSTNSNPANKMLIAEETGWANPRNWTTGGNLGQKCSTTYSPDGGMTFPYLTGIPLEAGQLYYIEAVHREGGGGDNLSVYAKLLYDTAPADGTPSTLTAASNNIAVMAGPVTTLTWVSEPPSSMSVAQGQTAQLNCQAVSDCEFPLFYSWYRVGVGAVGNAQSYTLTATPVDDGAQFYAVASTPIGGLTITSRVCTLSVQSAIFEPGFVKVEVWEGLQDRAAVRDGTAGLPTYTTTSPKFIQPLNVGDNYTRKVSGYFIPATNADYVFFLCSDDDSWLYLSTNDLPAGKQWIAEQTDWADPRKWLSGGNTTQKRSDLFTPDGGMTYPGSAGYSLVGGQKYYMEAIHREGSGGDNVGVTYNTVGEWDYPVDDAETRLSGNLIGMDAPRSRAWFVQQPANVVAAPYTYARFSVVGGTDSTLPVGSITDTARNRFLMYQWQRGGVDIPGATASTLTLMVTPADDGAQFACKMRSLGLADNALNPVWTNSATATLTVQGVFEPGVALVEFWPNTTGKDLVLNNVAGNPAYVTTSPAFEANTGGPGDPPAGVNDYVRRVSGHFIPAESGVYDFFVTSDDDCNVYLSLDISPLNKQLICQETAWSGGSRQWQTIGGGTLAQRRSDQWSPDGGITVPWAAGFNLTAGQKYYVEAVQHEGGGGDYVQVTAIKRPGAPPANGDASLLTGNVIGAYVPKSSMVAFTLQPTNVTVTGPVVANFYAAGISDSAISVGVIGAPVITEFLQYQWQKNGLDIPGATRSSLAYQVSSAADNGATFVCKIRGLGYSDASLNPIWSNSQPATLTINDPTPPALAYASFFTDINVDPNIQVVDILFNKRMDGATLANLNNYVIPGLTITAVTIRTNDYKAVRLTVTGTPTQPFTVTVNNLKDYLGNNLVSGSSLPVNSVSMISQDIGFDRGFYTNSQGTVFPLYDPQFPSLFWVDGPNAFTVSAQGSDIWGTNDGFNFTYEMKTNDFDVAVRQLYITKSSTWAKGGLMVRESLSPSSRYFYVVNTPLSADGIQAPDNSGTGANRVACGVRAVFGGPSADANVADPATQPPPAYPNAWLRLKRAGNVVSGYSSTNGVDWLLRGTVDTTAAGGLPAELYVGICTTAHNNDQPDAPWQLYWNTSAYADYMNVSLAAPVLQAAIMGNNIVISWSPSGEGYLVSSPTLGPSAVWTPVPGGANSPVTLPLTAGPVFFRVVR
ncbi:MAG TPA: hypothetical protein PKX23_00675 [Verrucomicrobiota bacterium]|nr:hypothetical protein [Verrucomicrobiota bacterium]